MTHRITQLTQKTIFPWNFSNKNLTLSPPVDVQGIRTIPSVSVTSALRPTYISSTCVYSHLNWSRHKRRSVCFCVRLLMECITKFKRETCQKYKTFISNLLKTNKKEMHPDRLFADRKCLDFTWLSQKIHTHSKPFGKKSAFIIKHWMWQTVDKLFLFASSFHVISFVFKYFQMSWSKISWAQENVE